jgi:low affinity Fe/Cu permease
MAGVTVSGDFMARKKPSAKAAVKAANGNGNGHSGWFERFARATALATGRPSAFLLAFAVVIVWVVTGPIFNFSDTWQLVINTGTTIVTFLMVFLIQQSQNRDTLAVQIKLAELIIAVKGAHNTLATAEDLSEQELAALHDDFCRKAEETLAHLEARRAHKKAHKNTKHNAPA